MPAANDQSALLEAAWGLIANANEGDWSKATAEWRNAAVRWRDQYHDWLDAALVKERMESDSGERITLDELDARHPTGDNDG